MQRKNLCPLSWLQHCGGVRSLFFYASVFHFHFSSRHIPGIRNVAADAISRDNLSLLSSLLSQATHVAVLPTVADFLLLNLDWGSPSWMELFTCSLLWDSPLRHPGAVKSGVHHYTAFCSTYNLTGFPLTELVLCLFVPFLVQDGLSYSSIRQYLSALRHTQLLSGGVDPSFSSLYRLHCVLRGCQRSLPSSVRKK